MIKKLLIERFKSIVKQDFELGRVNIFIGANGSGKSNVLEALGVLSAAANGRVDDEALIRRGVRPGVPTLYKCAFPNLKRIPHIHFSASSSSALYEVTLFNPNKDPEPAWRYHTENLKRFSDSKAVASRSHRFVGTNLPELGLAALSIAELDPKHEARVLLEKLQQYAIYAPTTSCLNGIVSDIQQRPPVGLSGGQLAWALSDLLRFRKSSQFAAHVSKQALDLIDWAKSYGYAYASLMPLSRSVASSKRVIRFTDRFMKENRNVLSGYDASEGALYVLFHAVMAVHPKVPRMYAIDNADHGLNPRLARALLGKICEWNLNSPNPNQVFLTTQNPYSLDELPLQNDDVRLFSVSRTNKGYTDISRVNLSEIAAALDKEKWPLSRLWVMGHIGGVPNV